MSLKHCEKTRKLWKHTLGNRSQASCGFFGRSQKPLAGNSLESTERACIMGRSATPLFSSSSYVLRIKCPSAAHTSCPQTWVCAGPWWLHKPHHQQSVRPEFIPTCPSHPETTKIIPWITRLGGYIWSVHSWIFMISEYLTAIHRELLRNLPSQQAAIPSTLVEPPPCVR